MVPVAEKPLTMPPRGPFWGAAGPSTVRVTGLVTPARVRSPIICSLPPTLEIEVDLKVRVGNFSTSKNSGLFRCLSRASLSVLTVSALMVASTEDLVTSWSFSSMVPAGPGEAAANVGDGEVADLELDAGVHGVNLPGGDLGVSGRGQDSESGEESGRADSACDVQVKTSCGVLDTR